MKLKSKDITKLQAGKIIPRKIIPKIFDPVFLNRGSFQGLSEANRRRAFNAISRWVNPNPGELTLTLSDQPYAKEMQRTLQNSVYLANQGRLPFGIIQLDNGNFVQMRGNLEELGRQYFGMQNQIIKPSYPVIRGQDLSLQEGTSSNSPIFFGFQGWDQGMVSPYIISKKIGKTGSLGDVFASITEKPEYYDLLATKIYDTGNRLGMQFDQAIEAGDYEGAAQIYAKAQGLPEYGQPWLLDRMKRVVPYDKASKYVPENRNSEMKRIFRAAIEPGTLRNPVLKYALTSSGRPDYNNARMSVFSGNPDRMGTGAAGYSLRTGTRVIEPNMSMVKWSYNTPAAKKVVIDANPEIAPELEKLKVINTDQIGRLYFDKGYDATLFPAADAHHPNLTEELQQGLWVPPVLFMSPTNKFYDNLYRWDRWRQGLKNGGKINRFKNHLHK